MAKRRKWILHLPEEQWTKAKRKSLPVFEPHDFELLTAGHRRSIVPAFLSAIPKGQLK